MLDFRGMLGLNTLSMAVPPVTLHVEHELALHVLGLQAVPQRVAQKLAPNGAQIPQVLGRSNNHFRCNEHGVIFVEYNMQKRRFNTPGMA